MLGMQDPTMTSLHSKHFISVGGGGQDSHCSTYHSHEFPSTSFIRQFFFAVAERHYGTQPTVQHNVDTVGLFSLSVKWRKTFVRKQEILWGEKKRKKEEEWVNQLETEWARERLSEWVSERASERVKEGRRTRKNQRNDTEEADKRTEQSTSPVHSSASFYVHPIQSKVNLPQEWRQMFDERIRHIQYNTRLLMHNAETREEKKKNLAHPYISY